MKRNNIQKDNSGKWLSFQSNPEEMSVLSSNMEKKIQENMPQAVEFMDVTENVKRLFAIPMSISFVQILIQVVFNSFQIH